VAEYSRFRPKPSLSSVPTSQSQEPCFLLRAIPLELRHMIFQTMAYKERTIYVDQYVCDKGPFHSLSKTCKKLSEEISEWVSKRSDIVDSPLSCPSVTTLQSCFFGKHSNYFRRSSDIQCTTESATAIQVGMLEILDAPNQEHHEVGSNKRAL
jgi:hypothetical protein